MPIRTCFSLPLGFAFIAGFLPAGAGEVDGLNDGLWSPTAKLELMVPRLAVNPWVEHTTLLFGNSGRNSYHELWRLMATPEMLLGLEPEEAFNLVGELMEKKLPKVEDTDLEDLSLAGPPNLREAIKLALAIQKFHPDWNPELVSNRLAESDRRLNEQKRYVEGRVRAAGKEAGEHFFLKVLEKAKEKMEAKEKTKPGSSAPDSPAQIYLQGHLRLTDALEKEGKGDFAGAYFKFREARDLFDSVYEADRLWNPEIVEYRRRKVREDMERVRLVETKQRAAGAATQQEKQPKTDKKEKEKKTQPDAPRKKGKPEVEALRQRLRETEQALQQSRQREAALRAVVRDLLNEMEALAPKPEGSRPLLPPLSEAPWKFAPPLLPSPPPLVPPAPPQPR